MLLRPSRRCALCGEGGDISCCHRCFVGVHFECWVELAGSRCPTLGCFDEQVSEDHAARILASMMREHEERTGKPPLGDDLQELVDRVARIRPKP